MINPYKLDQLLRREFGDPWVSDPPVWMMEVSCISFWGEEGVGDLGWECDKRGRDQGLD